MSDRNLVPIPLNLPGQIYRSPMPYARFDLGQTTFQEYLDASVDTVVMLIEEGEDVHLAGRDLKKEYGRHAMSVIHFPIPDFDTPEDSDELTNSLSEVIRRAEKGENIAIHCFAGRGRTGLYIALLARKVLGLGGQEAIEFVRNHFPAVETQAQEELVRNIW